jgi:adenylosuccinate synthase
MNRIREQGREFGATTGRPRRCGWLDIVMAKTAVMINDTEEIAITKLDVLGILDKILMCVGYNYKGKVFKEFPYDQEVIKNARPVYIEMPGWRENISGIRHFKDLPVNAKNYIQKIEELIKAKATIIAVGSKRSETIFR